MKYKLKTGNLITAEEIELIISKLLFEVIEQNSPHIWVPREEPIMSPYTGRVSYSSGSTLEKATFVQMEVILKGLRIGFRDYCYDSPIDELLQEIYISKQNSSLEPNCSNSWVSYHRLLKDKFDEWKSGVFHLLDDKGNHISGDLSRDIDDVFYCFIRRTPFDLYGKKILTMVKD